MMRVLSTALVAAILIVASSCSHRATARHAQPNSHHPSQATATDQHSVLFATVEVTWELRYYLVGDGPPLGADNVLLLKGPNPKQPGRVVGFVMEVIEPPEHAGQVLTAHFDAYGLTDGFNFYDMHKRYTEEVPRSAIGKFHFEICR